MLPEGLVNQILQTDCVQGMQQLPDCCIPLTVTSPPYDHLQNLRHPDYDRLVAQLYRVTEMDGVVAWVVGDAVVDGVETGTSCAHRALLEKAGFSIYQTLIAVTNGLLHPYARRYATAHEYIFVCAKGSPRTANVLHDKPNRTAGQDRNESRRDIRWTTPHWGYRTSVWTYPNGKYLATDKTAFGHPALMPEDLAEDLIVSYSRPGDWVFDPMCGAGTTCKMALLNGRRYLGMEIDERYFSLAKARLASARDKYKKLLDDRFGDDDRAA
jgi:site-specific DNA-methyltransferase (adenine-specific)